MIIKHSDKNHLFVDWFSFVFSKNKHNKKRVKVYVLLIFSALMCFFLGIAIAKAGLIGKLIIPKTNHLMAYSKNYVSGLFSKSENIMINIKFEDLQKLRKKRYTAINNQKLVTEADDYVPGVIDYNNQSVNAKLRLKGDNLDHLEGEKWSFRIKIQGDQTVFGMKIFSIHHPKTRNFIHEWIFHQSLKLEELIGLRYKFINVSLNGKNLGVYALEEHFEKRLIENNKHREGPIIRFNENLYWDEKIQQEIPFNDGQGVKTKNSVRRNGVGEYLSSEITTFQAKRWLSDSTIVLHNKAVHLLEDFRQGKLKTSDVFDTKKLAKFLALTDVMGAHHAAYWQGQRFYYNPIISRLEPIGFDGDSGTPINSLCVNLDMREIQIGSNAKLESEKELPYFNFFEMLFSDIAFYNEYVKSLEKFSQSKFLNNLFHQIDKELKNNLNIIHGEFPNFLFSSSTYYRNQEYIKTVLKPVKGIHAYCKNGKNNNIKLEIGNIHILPIQIFNISYKDSLNFSIEGQILQAKHPSKPVSFSTISLEFPLGPNFKNNIASNLKVHYRVLGSNYDMVEFVYPWEQSNNGIAQNDIMRQKPNVNEFEFLKIDNEHKKIFFKSGNWVIKKNLIVPPNYELIANDGVGLNLLGFTKIISYSPLYFSGSEDRPIIINSTDSKGQGIFVLETGKVSMLENVVFSNLSAPSHNGWELTGSVTFYESPFQMYNCKFKDSRSEDALNAVRSEFKIDGCSFEGSYSDAFDADFSKGEVRNTIFKNSKNDALDVSGSVLDIYDIFVYDSGDKGVSIGENSSVEASLIFINGAQIGIASKDQSSLICNNIEISNSKVGLALYQKKPEFGPSSIKMTQLSMENVGMPYFVESQSELILNGQVIDSHKQNFKKFILSLQNI